MASGYQADSARLAPSLIDLIRSQTKGRVLTFNTGNDFSSSEPASYLMKGRNEDLFVDLCHCDVEAVGPKDLERLTFPKALPPGFFRRIWSNVLTSNERRIFEQYRIFQIAGMKITVANFISSLYLKNIEAGSWDIECEELVRSLNRLLVNVKESDLYIFIAHLCDEDYEKLKARAPGNTVIVRVPCGNAHVAEQRKDMGAVNEPVYSFSMPDGNESLVVFDRVVHAGSRVETRVRRMPLQASVGRSRIMPESQELFPLADYEASCEYYIDKLLEEASKPACVLTADRIGYPPLYRFNPSYHAFLAREYTRSDIGIVACENEPLKNERILSRGFLLENIPNRYLRVYHILGADLVALFTEIGHDWSASRLGFSGISAALLNGELRELRIGGQLPELQKEYRIVMDENIYSDVFVSKILSRKKIPGYPSGTLWDAWLNVSHRLIGAPEMTER